MNLATDTGPHSGRGRVAAANYSAAALTEPDMRTTHPALWIDIRAPAKAGPKPADG